MLVKCSTIGFSACFHKMILFFGCFSFFFFVCLLLGSLLAFGFCFDNLIEAEQLTRHQTSSVVQGNLSHYNKSKDNRITMLPTKYYHRSTYIFHDCVQRGGQKDSDVTLQVSE